MKKEFFCVMSEFYDNGTVKAAIKTRVCREKPRDTYRELPFADTYHDWYDTREEAETVLAEYKAEGAAA